MNEKINGKFKQRDDNQLAQTQVNVDGDTVPE